MPGDQVKGKDSAIFFSSSSVARRLQTQTKRRNAFFYICGREIPVQKMRNLLYYGGK